MAKKTQYFALVLIVLGLFLNSGCNLLFGYNIVGEWFMEVTGVAGGFTWPASFTGSRGSGNASIEAFGATYTGTFTKSGKTVTIEVSSALGTITINWEFAGHSDRGEGSIVVNDLNPPQTLNLSFSANRRNF